jgi:hypothetical protein
MQLPGGDQQQVSGHHMDDLAFDEIGDIAGHEKVDFKEVMMVQFHVLQVAVPLILKLKIRGFHLLTGVKTLGLNGQKAPPPFDRFPVFIIKQRAPDVNERNSNNHNVLPQRILFSKKNFALIIDHRNPKIKMYGGNSHGKNQLRNPENLQL